MASADLLGAVDRPRRKWPILGVAGVLLVAVALASLVLWRDGREVGLLRHFGLAGDRTADSRQDPTGAPRASAEVSTAPQRDGRTTPEDGAPSKETGTADPPAELTEPPLKTQPISESAPSPRQAAPPPRPQPLSDCLAEIAVQAQRGLILAPDVTGDALAVFQDDTEWQERLAAMARVHGFHYSVNERLIEVWVKSREERAVGAAASTVQPGGEPPDADAPMVTVVDRPVHARASDLVAAVTKAARASEVQVSADPGSNAVVLAGTDAGVATISDLVRALDVPRRRFVLEAEIVELSRTAREELGVRWSIDGTLGGFVDFPAADTPGEGAAILVATDGAHALRARIGALEADGHVRVVSRPRVVVLEGRPASIESVRILRVRFPERTAIVGETGDAEALSGGHAVEEIPVGVTLRVEPSMQGDGRIVLRIRAKSSTLGPPQPPDGIPEELSRMVDAEVAVADGETAVLGGLMRQGTNRSGTGVPLLRSVPVVGLLFGKRQHEDEDEELAVLVTPRLLPP